MRTTASPEHLSEDTDVLLQVRDLVVEYPTKKGTVQAVSGISFDLHEGETLGIVGESGCGKSTTGRAVLRLERTTSGEILFDGVRIDTAGGRELRRLRRKMQMIFQDPVSSLNPRRTVADLVVEGMVIGDEDRSAQERTRTHLLETVGLGSERMLRMRPRELSGGQAQRVAIARALAVSPRLLICDEPVSALDVSVQAQVVNLLEDLRREFNLAIIFIAHDLSVVRVVSDKIMVMYLGKVCEYGDADVIYRDPAHPYTRALLDSVPNPSAEGGFTGPELMGDIPSPLAPPSGCRFRTRCPLAADICAEIVPPLATSRNGQTVACHFAYADAEPLGGTGAPTASQVGDESSPTT
jgi:peptide/nickel transport system ATP-binding protein